MNERTTEERIRELARYLAPVRPIPRLRAVAAAALGLWLVALGAEWLLGGRGVRLRSDGAWSDPSYLAALAGLALVALGATAAALAAAVPGREATARIGTGVTAAGLSIAIAGGLCGLAENGAAYAGAEDLRACLWCMSRALKLGLAPTLLACIFIMRAAVRRPATGAALALAGGVALGASAVHATCPSGSALHQLVAHTLAPVAAAAVLTLPLAALGRWLSGRRDRTT